MSKEHLPAKIDPIRFTENAIELRGIWPVKDLPRLTGSLYSGQGLVEAKFSFGVDHEGIRYCRGELTADLTLQCQRCMEAFNYTANDDFNFGIVNSEEEAEALPKRYDPILTEEGLLNILALVEDELIVSLPIVPMHDPKYCKVKLPLESESGYGVSNESPFKVIEVLRSKRDKK